MIRKKRKTNKLIIDLTGPQGNAYCILGYAKQLCTQLNKNWENIHKKMTSGDYENLIKTFDEEFGDYVILER